MNLKPSAELKDATAIGTAGNAKCGDILQIFLKIEDDIIVDVSFKPLLRSSHCFKFYSNKDGIGKI